MELKVYDYLHYGKEQAVRTKDLAAALGFNSVRDLQKQIDDMSRQLRITENLIQSVNWTTELK